MIILDMDSSVSPTYGDQERFASPEAYEFLEPEGFLYTIRLPANRVLRECIAHLRTRPLGRPPNHVRRTYASFSYRAKSWDKARP